MEGKKTRQRWERDKRVWKGLHRVSEWSQNDKQRTVMIELELTMGHGPGQLTEPTGPTQLLLSRNRRDAPK